jgi:hypothetical protein
VNKPKLAVPAGATDTHIHIYQESVPPAPGGPPLPGHFPVEASRKSLNLSLFVEAQSGPSTEQIHPSWLCWP